MAPNATFGILWKSVKVGLRLAVLGFCSLHVCALLEYNARPIGGDKALASAFGQSGYDALHEKVAVWCRALGAEQRWNMFSNVGSYSNFPLISIVRKDGTRILLHSTREPELPNLREGANYLDAKMVSEEERVYSHRINFGNGRLRKLEDNVIEGPLGYTASRLTWCRFRLREYFLAYPEERDKVARIDVLRLTLRHPDDDHPARLAGVEHVMIYDPRFDGRWPKEITLSHVP
jgi:hypothetical protein